MANTNASLATPVAANANQGGAPGTGVNTTIVSPTLIATPESLKMQFIPSPSPYAIRPQDPDKLGKLYEKATKGHKAQYSGEDPKYTLQMFSKAVETHLIRFGLQEEFFFIDARDNKRKNILHHYDCFTAEEIAFAANAVYNQEKINNMHWAGEFLRDSLSSPQLQRLAKYHYYPTHGPVVWMLIIKENWSSSEAALKGLVYKLENMSLSTFEGENVSEFATTVADICQRLEAAHMLPREIVTILCNIFET
ncbi:MAG: hypothetical protein ACREBR_00440, partial [bacterium]